MDKFVGTGVALITPFNDDLTVDTLGLTNIVEHCIEGGVNYLVVLGTTAEAATLTNEEKQLVISTIVNANSNRLPLVLGIGGNDTRGVVNTINAQDLRDFDAILSVSPYYNKPTQEGIYQHFMAISEASPLPIIMYNVPGRTSSNMRPETVLRLANDAGNIVAIKEASGDLGQIMHILKNKPKDFLVISGDDLTALSTVLAGGSGVISVLGQGLPKEFSNMIDLGLNSWVQAANKLQYSLLDGMGLIFEEGNPAGIKAAMHALGLCNTKVRLPLIEASDSLQNKIDEFMKPYISLQV